MNDIFAADDRPFFLFCSFWKPHAPFAVPQPFDSMYDDVEIPLPEPMTKDEIMRLPPPLRTLILRFRPVYDMDRTRLQWIYRSYYGEIRHIDREVGLILQALEKAGVADNTIVVFTSDIDVELSLRPGRCQFAGLVLVFRFSWSSKLSHSFST